MKTILKNKSPVDKETLYESNQGLIYDVYKKVNKKSHIPLPFEDAINEGGYYLWKACLTFDESKNIKFSTYAFTVIKNGYLRIIKNEIIHHNNVFVYSLDAVVPESDDNKQLTYKDTLVDFNKNVTEQVCNQIYNQNILNKFNKDYGEKFLKYLKLKYFGGYELKRIKKILNLNKSDIVKYRKIIKKMKAKGGF